MAGIGFRLRKPLEKGTYLGLVEAYAYAGVISSGPWVLSILGILVISFLTAAAPKTRADVLQFQVSATYLIAFSLILSGFLHLAFTRFVADRLFERKDRLVLPNFLGALYLTTIASGATGAVCALWLFAEEGISYRLLMLAGFVILCNIWIATLLLSGLKFYKGIVACFALGYGLTVLVALLLQDFGVEGLLAGFVLGQFVLLVSMMLLLLKHYQSDHLLAFDFTRRGQTYVSLLWVGFFYALAIWVDKILFWYYPATGYDVIGPLRASPVYDLPMFLAYLSIIPGMAVYLLRIETDFVEYYKRFYDAVRDGGSLTKIEEMRNEMVFAARQGISEVIKVQAVAVLLGIVGGPWLWRQLGYGELYLPLLYIDLVSVGILVVLLGLLNVFFYLDKRRTVVAITLLFLVGNTALTFASLKLGVPFYGYGFALSLLLCVVISMYLLDRSLNHLEYETFMLQ